MDEPLLEPLVRVQVKWHLFDTANNDEEIVDTDAQEHEGQDVVGLRDQLSKCKCNAIAGGYSQVNTAESNDCRERAEVYGAEGAEHKVGVHEDQNECCEDISDIS